MKRSYWSLLATDAIPKYLPYRYDLRSADNFRQALLNRLNMAPKFNVQQFDSTLMDDVVNRVILDLQITPLVQRFTYDQTLHWLEERPYTRARKESIKRAASRITQKEWDSFEIDHKIMGFIKDETYSKIKPPRLIATRSDRSKFMLGPYFNYIDEHLFNSKYSIKHIPYYKRPSVVAERFKDHTGHYLCLDYTSFECSASYEAQINIEYRLYRKIFPPEIFEALVKHLLCPRTKIQGYALGSAIISPVRYSGEMNTSCGNTLYNLLAIKYAGMKCGCNLNPLVEGDDSLIPIPEHFPITKFLGHLSDLGLITKYEVFDYHGDAGYCSSYWTRTTAKPRCNIVDFALNILYAPQSNFRALGPDLLASKVTSYAIQYPHTPIIAAFARKLGNSEVIFKYNSYLYEEYSHNAKYMSIDGDWCHAHFDIDTFTNDDDYREFCTLNRISRSRVKYCENLIDEGKFVTAMNYLLDNLHFDGKDKLRQDTHTRFTGRNVLWHVNATTVDQRRIEQHARLVRMHRFADRLWIGSRGYCKPSSEEAVHPNWVHLYRRRVWAQCRGRTPMSSNPDSRWFKMKHPLLLAGVTSLPQSLPTLRTRKETMFSLSLPLIQLIGLEQE